MAGWSDGENFRGGAGQDQQHRGRKRTAGIEMKRVWKGGAPAGLAIVLTVSGFQSPAAGVNEDTLQQARNLGKAFYENPTTQAQSVDQFKKALDMQPNSARERVNYGIALLRNAKTKEGIEELVKAQK